MPSKNIQKILVLASVGIIMLACSLTGNGTTNTDSTVSAGTQVAQTLNAQMTQIAIQATNTPLFPSPTASPTTAAPSSTPNPTNTQQPTATNTQAPTATPVPCNKVGFIADMTVPDGSLFIAGAEFSKVWRIKNVGSCAWTADYSLVYYSGNRMQGNSVTDFDMRVDPGETIDVSVDLIAPANDGDYLGYWMLRTAGGTLFGMGSDHDEPFWVEIEVIDPGTSYVYSFAENICDARWEDSSAPLPCQGTTYAEDNAVRLSDAIEMETGVTENELGLWINLGRSGVVEGKFPAITVQTGDRFVAEIGCIEDSEECHARFTLSYKEVGTSTVVELGSWVEEYDDDTMVINEDLSGLAGKEVKFILTVTSLNTSESTEVFWFVPRIQNP